MIYQQGDVVLEGVDFDTAEIEASGEEKNDLVLAEGEATGHMHQIVEGVAKLIVFKELLYLKVISETAKLRHNEHSLKKTIGRYGNYNKIPNKDIKYLKSIGIKVDKKIPFTAFLEKVPDEIVLPSGFYEVKQVKRYDHLDEEIKRVVD